MTRISSSLVEDVPIVAPQQAESTLRSSCEFVFQQLRSRTIQAAKSKITFGLVATAAVVWYYYPTWAYTAMSPYRARNTKDNNSLFGYSWRCLRTVLQRIVVDNTRGVLHFVDIYPLDYVNDWNTRRNNENGHAVSGGVRDAARIAIDAFVRSKGCTIWELNPSNRSSADGGHHLHNAPGDLSSAATISIPKETDMIVGIDVDYYLRDPGFLLGHALPVLLHTFNPRAVCGYDGESPFTIIDNRVEYRVSGGGLWEHPVWNWCEPGEYVEAECIFHTLSKRLLALFGRIIGLRPYVVHKIHSGRPFSQCPHRALVYTVPQYTYWRFSWMPTEFSPRQLQEIDYRDRHHLGYNRLEYMEGRTLMASVGREGEMACFQIRRELLDALMACASPQSVMTRLLTEKITDATTTALVSQYFANRPSLIVRSPFIVSPVVPKAHVPLVNYIDVAETSSREYTAPIVDNPSLQPMIKRWEAMSSSIEHRVTHYHNPVVPGGNATAAARSFVELLVPERHQLDPLPWDDVIAAMDKPSQVLAIRNIMDDLPLPYRNLIDSFLKNEPTDKDARLISGFADMRFVLRLSRFTHAFDQAITKTDHCAHFYFPGRNCQQIESGVVDFTTAEQMCVAETDFENLDGTVSEWMQRAIGCASMLAAFKPEYHVEINQLMGDIIRAPARAKRFGFRYEAGVGVKSGSPTTTLHNTLYNAFIEFYARTLRYGSDIQSARVAFLSLGPKYGDDGLISWHISKAVNSASSELGLKLKIERYRPEIGLGFLGRVFIDPMHCPDSVCDPLRTWRKIHCTTRHPGIPLADAAIDRAEGYLVTDKVTPVVGNYFRMVKRCYAATASADQERASRKSQTAERPYWANSGSWTQSDRNIDIMYNVIAERTGILALKLRQFDSLLASIDDVSAMPSPALAVDCKYKNHIDVDVVFVEPVGPSFQSLQDAVVRRATPGRPRVPKDGRNEFAAPVTTDSRPRTHGRFDRRDPMPQHDGPEIRGRAVGHVSQTASAQLVQSVTIGAANSVPRAPQRNTREQQNDRSRAGKRGVYRPKTPE